MLIEKNNIEAPTIIFITHVVPYPPAAGNEIRILKMLKWLKKKGCINILLLNAPKLEPDARQGLEGIVDKIHLIGEDFGVDFRPIHSKKDSIAIFMEKLEALIANTPFRRLLYSTKRQNKIKSEAVKKYLAPDRLIQVTEHLCEKYKPCAVIAEYIFTAPCFAAVPDGILKIIDTHDMFSRKREQVLSFGIEDPLPCTRREERNYLLKCDLIIAIQSNEARMFRELVPGKDVITVGIDFDVIDEIDNGEVIPGSVLVVGSDNPLNIHGLKEFLHNSWPTIRAGYPGANVRVVGKLAKHVQTDDERVQLVGWVPDLDKEYRKAAVVINPTVAGTGLKIKTVEALCRAKSFVGTLNSVEGIDYSGEPPYIVSENWIKFAEAVISILRSGKEPSRLQRRALEFANDNFSSDKIYAQLGDRIQRFHSIRYQG